MPTEESRSSDRADVEKGVARRAHAIRCGHQAKRIAVARAEEPVGENLEPSMLMIEQGGGVVCNVASVAGHLGVLRAPNVVVKHGPVGFTRTLAVACSRDGIRVNAVGPGAIHAIPSLHAS